MRTAVLVIDYIFSVFIIIVGISSLSSGDITAVLGLVMFLAAFIPNIVYVHQTKPVDTEKENLKKQIEELSKKIENTNN